LTRNGLARTYIFAYRHDSGDVFVLKVKPDGGCERAGVEAGSKITAVDGENMHTKLANKTLSLSPQTDTHFFINQ